MFKRLREMWAEAGKVAAPYHPGPRKVKPKPTLKGLPRCPFCRHDDRQFGITGSATLVNSRINTARVKMAVRCLNCGMYMTAQRPPYNTNWTFGGSP